MDSLKFNEENKAMIHVPELTQRDEKGNKDLSGIGEARRSEGLVEIAFYGEDFEYSTNPSIEQLNAFNYIVENQIKLVKAFFKYTKEVLYPTHIEFIGFDKVFFPKIKKVKDLRKSLGIFEIYIWKEHKNDRAYVAYCFDFTGDFEHGVILIAHEDRILGWEEDLVKDKILADLS